MRINLRNKELSLALHPTTSFWTFRRMFISQKNPCVRHFSARDSGAENGCANFMGAWHFLVFSAGKPPRP